MLTVDILGNKNEQQMKMIMTVVIASPSVDVWFVLFLCL